MKYYIEFLNKNKGFKKDIKYFETFEQARNWCLETFDKFDPDYIKQDENSHVSPIFQEILNTFNQH